MITTFLAGLSIILVVYIAYILISSAISYKPSAKTHAVEELPEAKPEKLPETKPEEPQPTEVPSTEAEPAPEQPQAAQEEGDEKPTELRHPETGETAAVPTSYRFAKKWIKEAMVAEGLLDKVYKNAELDEETGEKVKEALERFKTIQKYWA